MNERDVFKPGDRVRVAADYWVGELAGHTGCVSEYPEGCGPTDPGCCWVELDVEEWKIGVTDGAEVDAEHLELL